MKKIKRKSAILAIFTAAAIALGGCETSDPEECFYEYEEILSETGQVLGINLTACSRDTEEIRVPEKIGGKRVLRIGNKKLSDSLYNGVFESCSPNIKRIVIPEGVEEIEGGVFENSVSIQNVYLPEGLVYLGPSAFAHCEGLTDIEIPEGISELCNGVFSGCASLTDITLPEGIKSIGQQCFADCVSLEKAELPSDVESIGVFAFSGCAALSELTLNEGLLSIGEMAFDGCTGLTDITVPDTVETIGRDAFNGCHDVVVHYRGMDYTYPELYNIYTVSEGDELPEFFIPNKETE